MELCMKLAKEAELAEINELIEPLAEAQVAGGA